MAPRQRGQLARGEQGEVLGQDLRTLADDHRGLHGVLELADVSGPVVPPQELQGFRPDPFAAPEPVVEHRDEVFRQEVHVRWALPQRGVFSVIVLKR